jgi:hypothetical protein
MYSGTTFNPWSGNVMGAHQKLDRVARKDLAKLLGEDKNHLFPKSRLIIHFEGNKGPDAIKRKSPAKDEPWHYYSPFDDEDSKIFDLIEAHYKQLVKELKNKNEERIAFEAAWLAHTLVDGLTPAHHYPYEETLEELRGEGIETRTTLRKKLIINGDTKREMLSNNWKMWGPKGLMTAHSMFELGVAAIIAPISMKDSVPKDYEMKEAYEVGITEYFKRSAREIAVIDMYLRYIKKGWTAKLVHDVRHKLGPIIARTVAIAWYLALIDAGLIKPPKK